MNFIGDEPTGAVFSLCRCYRYTLWRRFQHDAKIESMIAFIGLNPSTADEVRNDPTVTRCINYAKAWGFDGYIMLNLFAFRATDPKVMKSQIDPMGPDNLEAILQVCSVVPKVVCAWGTHGALNGCGDLLKKRLQVSHGGKVHHLGLTKDGFPKHPLYLRSDLLPQPWI